MGGCLPNLQQIRQRKVNKAQQRATQHTYLDWGSSSVGWTKAQPSVNTTMLLHFTSRPAQTLLMRVNTKQCTTLGAAINPRDDFVCPLTPPSAGVAWRGVASARGCWWAKNFHLYFFFRGAFSFYIILSFFKFVHITLCSREKHSFVQ